MGANSDIEWTDSTWNPTVGCSVLTPGCTNCYAMKLAGRLEAMGSPIYAGHTTKTKAGFVWNGKVSLSNWGQIIKPLSWKAPRRIFVNSMSDLFHEALTDAEIDQVFAVMALAPRHTFQVLTKRAQRMRYYFGLPTGDPSAPDREAMIRRAVFGLIAPGFAGPWSHLSWVGGLPLPNVWLGVSVEDQARANERIPFLLKTPAAVRFLSCEPLLGSLDLKPFLWTQNIASCRHETNRDLGLSSLGWVIAGGESGPKAREMKLEWMQSLLLQCKAAGVPFFGKQLGSGFHLRDRKGGDWDEWPYDLRVREFPKAPT